MQVILGHGSISSLNTPTIAVNQVHWKANGNICSCLLPGTWQSHGWICKPHTCKYNLRGAWLWQPWWQLPVNELGVQGELRRAAKNYTFGSYPHSEWAPKFIQYHPSRPNPLCHRESARNESILDNITQTPSHKRNRRHQKRTYVLSEVSHALMLRCQNHSMLFIESMIAELLSSSLYAPC